MDNGSGIDGEFESVWKPGRMTRRGYKEAGMNERKPNERSSER